MIWKLQENVLSKDDVKILVDFIKKTKRFTQFDKVREFESMFSRWLGTKYSVFVNSGSSANLLLINALKELYHWELNDEIGDFFSESEVPKILEIITDNSVNQTIFKSLKSLKF